MTMNKRGYRCLILGARTEPFLALGTDGRTDETEGWSRGPRGADILPHSFDTQI